MPRLPRQLGLLVPRMVQWTYDTSSCGGLRLGLACPAMPLWTFSVCPLPFPLVPSAIVSPPPFPFRDFPFARGFGLPWPVTRSFFALLWTVLFLTTRHQGGEGGVKGVPHHPL